MSKEMTTEHVSVPRDEFEKWMIEEMGYPRADLYFASARNCYRSYHVHLAWKAWEQAILSRATPGDEVATSLPAARVPDGWKLVPVEPTEDMIMAASNAAHDVPTHKRWMPAAWRAALAAAPQAGERG